MADPAEVDQEPFRTFGDPLHPSSDQLLSDAFPEMNSNQPDSAILPVQTKSKTALKKELRFQKRTERCKINRANEKLRRKEKLLASRKRMQAASTPEHPYVSRRVERRMARDKLTKALTEGVRLCVDMSFEELMSPKEIGQLASQICYMYSSNKKVEKPFCMHLTSLKQGTKLHEEVVKRCPGFDNYKIKVFEDPLEKVFQKEELVYMSPDSPNILERIDPSKVYVIGGLVDGTPKRQVSLSRAQALNCQSVRLPIAEHMKRSASHGNTILTLNQVYEILMRFNETNSWEQALDACVPRRKGFTVNGQADTPTAEEEDKTDVLQEETNRETITS
ncbi:tRNA methyltransferase 10 homolog B-like [Paramacrobiotus metropolitanus]|uniref:tRNA methyltransferase 10 homolog B-like n=1 Tax=Paramacrobiotus metropolitanus TaxID=2943436 RepID=UPI0024463488|nr:tRNA methyltransferase 10 homolog B-like [Paramacrobiotus metropolitanus]